MKNKKAIVILTTSFLVVFILLFNAFKKDRTDTPKKEKTSEIVETKYDCAKYLFNNKQNNLNISILLDLSDRISDKKYPNPTMSYLDRDLGYIKSISSAFSNSLLNKKSILMNDKIQMFLEPAPADQSINEKITKLNLNFTRGNATKKTINNIIPNYEDSSKEIYDLAIKDGKYIGSDIWRFFKDKVSNYCVEDCYRNILIILTDGYIYHKNTKLKEGGKTTYITPQTLRYAKLNKGNFEEIMKQKEYGFLVSNKNLQDLEVLVLGIENHDKNNMYGKDVIKKYWSDWLKAMNVKRFELHDADLPVNMDKIIRKFIK